MTESLPSEPLSIVCMKWTAPFAFRSKYTADHVNRLQKMVAKFYPHEHRFICITDDARGLDPSIEHVPLWSDYGMIPPPQGGMNPSCYRRLKLFSAEMEDLLGPRFVSIDLDCVMVADPSPLWHRPEEFVIARFGAIKNQIYNGSMFLMTAGAREQVWKQFDPYKSPRRAKRAGLLGSDQAWIQHCLGEGEATWGHKDGIFAWRTHIARTGGKLPAGAKVVFFQGKSKPWHRQVQKIAPWIRRSFS